MTARSPEADALTELILEIFRVNGDLLTAGDRISGEYGQTSSRWQVLGAIRNGPLPVSGIAREMGRARQSVQRTADLLAAEGLVEYADNPAHRRAKLVRLSWAGTETLAGISRRQVEWTNRLARELPFDEREIRLVLAVLRHLRVELERSDDGASPGAPASSERPRAAARGGQ